MLSNSSLLTRTEIDSEMQQFLAARPHTVAPSEDISRNLLAQLQHGQQNPANIPQNLLNPQNPQLGKLPRQLSDMERLMLERQLQGPRDNPVCFPRPLSSKVCLIFSLVAVEPEKGYLGSPVTNAWTEYQAMSMTMWNGGRGASALSRHHKRKGRCLVLFICKV